MIPFSFSPPSDAGDDAPLPPLSRTCSIESSGGRLSRSGSLRRTSSGGGVALAAAVLAASSVGADAARAMPPPPPQSRGLLAQPSLHSLRSLQSVESADLEEIVAMVVAEEEAPQLHDGGSGHGDKTSGAAAHQRQQLEHHGQGHSDRASPPPSPPSIETLGDAKAAQAPSPAPANDGGEGSSTTDDESRGTESPRSTGEQQPAATPSDGGSCRVARIGIDLDAAFVRDFGGSVAAAEAYAREAVRAANGVFAPVGLVHEIAAVTVRGADAGGAAASGADAAKDDPTRLSDATKSSSVEYAADGSVRLLNVADLPAHATRLDGAVGAKADFGTGHAVHGSSPDTAGSDDAGSGAGGGSSLLLALRDSWEFDALKASTPSAAGAPDANHGATLTPLSQAVSAAAGMGSAEEIDAVLLFTGRHEDDHEEGSEAAGHKAAGSGPDSAVEAASGAVGLAWVGGMCASQGKFAAVRRLATPTLQADLVAHELGHLWGAAHSLPGSSDVTTMWPTVRGALEFSSSTAETMSQHADTLRWCLEETTGARCGGANDAVGTTVSARAAGSDDDPTSSGSFANSPHTPPFDAQTGEARANQGQSSAHGAGDVRPAESGGEGMCAGKCESLAAVQIPGGGTCHCDPDCDVYGDCCEDVCDSCGAYASFCSGESGGDAP